MCHAQGVERSREGRKEGRKEGEGEESERLKTASRPNTCFERGLVFKLNLGGADDDA